MQLEELKEFCNQTRAEASGDKNMEEKDRQGRPRGEGFWTRLSTPS